jgi:hypothetical protein
MTPAALAAHVHAPVHHRSHALRQINHLMTIAGNEDPMANKQELRRILSRRKIVPVQVVPIDQLVEPRAVRAASAQASSSTAFDRCA